MAYPLLKYLLPMEEPTTFDEAGREIQTVLSYQKAHIWHTIDDLVSDIQQVFDDRLRNLRRSVFAMSRQAPSWKGLAVVGVGAIVLTVLLKKRSKNV